MAAAPTRTFNKYQQPKYQRWIAAFYSDNRNVIIIIIEAGRFNV